MSSRAAKLRRRTRRSAFLRELAQVMPSAQTQCGIGNGFGGLSPAGEITRLVPDYKPQPISRRRPQPVFDQPLRTQNPSRGWLHSSSAINHSRRHCCPRGAYYTPARRISLKPPGAPRAYHVRPRILRRGVAHIIRPLELQASAESFGKYSEVLMGPDVCDTIKSG